MSSLLLQIFLLVNVFIIGVVTVIAIQHAKAHLQAKKQPKRVVSDQVVHIPAAMKQHLLETSQTHFQAVLDHAANELQQDLHVTSEQLNKRLASLGSDIVAEEMKRYKASLDDLRHQTEATIGGAVSEVATHQTDINTKLTARQAELEAKLVEEIAAEKEQLIAQMDTKLADAVSSFLIETLQHNVDLGAQSAYLIETLEEHKVELAKGIRDDT